MYGTSLGYAILIIMIQEQPNFNESVTITTSSHIILTRAPYVLRFNNFLVAYTRLWSVGPTLFFFITLSFLVILYHF